MNKKNEIKNQKLSIDNLNKKLKEFLSVIKSKKETIKTFKKRHINYINKNKEKKTEIITLKIYSLNNFITEFEKLIQFSLELILFIQESFKQNLNSENINIDNKKDDDSNYLKYYNISNLNITDKLRQKRNPIEYNCFSDNIDVQNRNIKNNTFNNFSNYNSVRNQSNKDFINNNEYSSYNYNYTTNYSSSLKERTLNTLYNRQYFPQKNNYISNRSESSNKIKSKKIKVPIRTSLRTLIKEKNIDNNMYYIFNNEIEKSNDEKLAFIEKINESEKYKFYFSKKYGNGNYFNFLTKYKNGQLNDNDIKNELELLSNINPMNDNINNYRFFNEHKNQVQFNKSKTPSGKKRKFLNNEFSNEN